MSLSSKTIALLGSETLLGREIRDIVATTSTDFDLRLIAADEEHPGTLTRVGDEPALVEGLGPDSLTGVSAVFLTGSTESANKALALAAEEGVGAVIDLTFTAEDSPGARLRAPQAETDLEETPEAAIHVIAHPAAIALALFLRRLQMHDPIRRSVIQIFAPASEHGTAGVKELQEQTVSLLSFKPMPKAIFDSQLSFSLLPGYGEDAPVSLEDSELRIEKHLASLLALPGEGEGAPLPSLRMVQAPVFHGYSFSAWVEFEENPGVEALENGLATEAIEVRGDEVEPPNNVGQAGSGGIAVGSIALDRNEPEACWFWLVADNLRVAAENAVAVARQLV